MSNLLFVLESFRRHMDNGRWLFQCGMEAAGWQSVGCGLTAPGVDSTDVQAVCERHQPRAVIFWPRYEWDSREWGGPEVRPEYGFHNWRWLLDRPEIARITVWHDAGSARQQQKRWHEDFRPHYYLSWYHPESVMPFAPYVRREQILRTCHVLDSDNLPPVGPRDGVAVVTGAATPDVYPLRTRCLQWARAGKLGPGVDAPNHPGYPQTGSVSNAYVAMLARYRVAVCTCSAYKFALRKIFEATAAGCRVVTNLPRYDVLEGVEENLMHVSDDIDSKALASVIACEAAAWDHGRQAEIAERVRRRYHYRAECGLLAREIERRTGRDAVLCG